MCGIVAFSGNKGMVFDPVKISYLMFFNFLKRGPDSTGFYTTKSGIVKEDKSGPSFLAKNPILPDSLFIGHVRAATIGGRSKYNTHPFQVSDTIGVHNGTLLDPWPFCAKYKVDHATMQVDSHGLIAVIAKTRSFKCMEHAEGSAAIVLTNTSKKDEGKLFVYRNGRTLYHGTLPEGLYVSSEEDALKLLHCTDVKQFTEDVVYTLLNGEIKEYGEVKMGSEVAKRVPVKNWSASEYADETADDDDKSAYDKYVGFILRLDRQSAGGDPINLPLLIQEKYDFSNIKWFHGYKREDNRLIRLDVPVNSIDLNSKIREGCYASTLVNLKGVENPDKVLIKEYTLCYVTKITYDKVSKKYYAEVLIPGGTNETIVPVQFLLRLNDVEVAKINNYGKELLPANSTRHNEVQKALDKNNKIDLKGIVSESIALVKTSNEADIIVPDIPEETEDENLVQQFSVYPEFFNFILVALTDAEQSIVKAQTALEELQKDTRTAGIMKNLVNAQIAIVTLYDSIYEDDGTDETPQDATETLDEKIKKKKQEQATLTPIETMIN